MKKNYFLRWLLLAPAGLVLIGAGLSFFGEALRIKMEMGPFWEWFGMGTFALVLVNAGVSCVGEAVVNRVFHKIRQRRRAGERRP